MGRSSNGIVIFGAILLLAGIAAFAYPMFTTEHTTDVAKLGDLKVQAKEDQTHVIPPLVSEGAMVVGALLIGVGMFRRT